jgi:hypothetical protein
MLLGDVRHELPNGRDIDVPRRQSTHGVPLDPLGGEGMVLAALYGKPSVPRARQVLADQVGDGNEQALVGVNRRPHFSFLGFGWCRLTREIRRLVERGLVALSAAALVRQWRTSYRLPSMSPARVIPCHRVGMSSPTPSEVVILRLTPTLTVLGNGNCSPLSVGSGS